MDLTYTTGNMFTTFYANTPDGVTAWNEMAKMQDGAAVILNNHLSSTIYQLKKAGYSVGKEKPNKLTIDEILAELAA